MKIGQTFGCWRGFKRGAQGVGPEGAGDVGAACRSLMTLGGLVGALALTSCAHCPEHGGGCCAPAKTGAGQPAGTKTSDTSKVVYPVADTRAPMEGARAEVRETPIYQAPNHRSSDFPRYR